MPANESAKRTRVLLFRFRFRLRVNCYFAVSLSKDQSLVPVVPDRVDREPRQCARAVAVDDGPGVNLECDEVLRDECVDVHRRVSGGPSTLEPPARGERLGGRWSVEVLLLFR